MFYAWYIKVAGK